MSTLATTIGRGVTGSRPAASEAGRLYYDTTVSILYRDNGSSWDSISASALTNPMTTSQDTIVGGASGTPGRLAVGAAGAAYSVINGAVAWNSGTSFPGSKLTGDRYWRTDLGLECYWDGTRWLTVSPQFVDFGIQTALLPLSSTTGTSALAVLPYRNLRQIYVTSVDVGFFVSGGTALGASHKWVGTVIDDAATIATINIDSGTSTVWRSIGVTVNAVYGDASTADHHMELTWTKTGTPGPLYAGVRVHFRQVVT